MNKHAIQNRFMRKRAIILIATILSLGVASSAFAHYRHHGYGYGEHGNGFAKHIERNLTEKLELNETQQAELQQLTESLMTSRKSFRKQRFFDFDEVVTLLESNQLNQQRALEMVRARLAMIESQAQEIIASASGFTDSLTAEQRAELKEIIEQRVSGRQHRNRKFDSQ